MGLLGVGVVNGGLVRYVSQRVKRNIMHKLKPDWRFRYSRLNMIFRENNLKIARQPNSHMWKRHQPDITLNMPELFSTFTPCHSSLAISV